MRRLLTLTLLVLGLASPTWAATEGWFKGPGTTYSAVSNLRVQKHQTVYWVRTNTAVTASPTLNVEDCASLTTSWCLVPVTADQNAGALATIFLYGSTDTASTVVSPYDADIDGGGVDHVGLTGDCGNDGDDNGTELNDSLWYGWSPSKPYLFVVQTVALEANKSIILSLTCQED